MTIPLWVLLGFALWTLALLAATVGFYRLSRILSGRSKPTDFPATNIEGADWYKRAVRAHMNCVENLPVYASLALVARAAGIDTGMLDVLAIVFFAARIGQSLVHVALVQTNNAVSLRFSFFFAQFVCMMWMGVYLAVAAS